MLGSCAALVSELEKSVIAGCQPALAMCPHATACIGIFWKQTEWQWSPHWCWCLTSISHHNLYLLCYERDKAKDLRPWLQLNMNKNVFKCSSGVGSGCSALGRMELENQYRSILWSQIEEVLLKVIPVVQPANVTTLQYFRSASLAKSS